MDIMPDAIEQQKELKIIGMTVEVESAPVDAYKCIRVLWKTFNANLWKISNRVNSEAWNKFGVSYNRQPGDKFTYFAGVEVEALDSIPEGMAGKQIPAVACARFSHKGDVKKINETIFSIFNHWLPDSGYNVVPGWQCGIDYYEKYDKRFKWSEADSVIDVFLPVVKK
ncbi:GyrI-like domain-containing protein [bacterium]|nr:GyrI-like domain-containing protein [bacterium]